MLVFSTTMTTSCFSQSTLSELVTTLGNTGASIASIEGDSSLATKLQADTAAASTAILDWKKGSSATEVLEAINVVTDDLSIIPISDPTTLALVDLALGTVSSIIDIIDSEAGPAAISAFHVNRIVTLKNPPKTRNGYIKQFKAIAAGSKYDSVEFK